MSNKKESIKSIKRLTIAEIEFLRLLTEFEKKVKHKK